MTSIEKTRTAMVISLVALPVNIGINWLLIFGNLGFPELGLPGAGWGTLITRTLMFLTLGGVILYHPLFRRYIMVRRNQWKLRLATIRELLHIGIPSGLQVGMEGGAFALSGIIIGTLGATEQAAHQIALSCASFTFMVSLGLSQGSSIRVSNAFGTLNRDKIINIGKSTLITALAYGVFCAILFIACRNILPRAFNEDVSVVKMASLLLVLAAMFQISDATQVIGAGLMRGIKDVKIPTDIGRCCVLGDRHPGGIFACFLREAGCSRHLDRADFRTYLLQYFFFVCVSSEWLIKYSQCNKISLLNFQSVDHLLTPLLFAFG